MCLLRLENFVCVTLHLIFWYDNFFSIALDSSMHLNGLEDNNKKFENESFEKYNKHPEIDDIFGRGNFAEGGVVSLNNLEFQSGSKNETSPKILNEDGQIKTSVSQSSSNKSIISKHLSKSLEKEISTSEASVNRFVTTNKLNDLNLLLGVPEVVHINGVSSIKPRKGVYYNKIVPRKGVDIFSETYLKIFNNSFNSTCFKINEKECYKALDFFEFKCNCCKEKNDLNKIFPLKNLQNCSACKEATALLLGKNTECQHVCCENKLSSKEMYSVSTTEDMLDKNLVYLKGNKHSGDEKYKEEKLDIKLLANSSKISKSKPIITKVPYDFDVITNLIAKSDKQNFVPVIILIFFLPLIGVIIFLLWRRTKEYWSKRYYKKVDFLIDGMYND